MLHLYMQMFSFVIVVISKLCKLVKHVHVPLEFASIIGILYILISVSYFNILILLLFCLYIIIPPKRKSVALRVSYRHIQ